VSSPATLCALCQVSRRLGGPIVVQKGPEDGIANESTTVFCTEEGSPRRAGGQVGVP
jgi:hypothetical protein